MFPRLYTSYDSGPKSPLIRAWPLSLDYISCLGEPSDASNANAMPIMNLVETNING